MVNTNVTPWPLKVKQVLDDAGVYYSKFAEFVGVRRETVSRWWSDPESANTDLKTANRIVTFCQRHDSSVTHESLFGSFPRQKSA